MKAADQLAVAEAKMCALDAAHAQRATYYFFGAVTARLAWRGRVSAREVAEMIENAIQKTQPQTKQQKEAA